MTQNFHVIIVDGTRIVGEERGHTMAIRQEHWILRTGLLAGVAAVIASAYWWHQKPVDRAASLTPPTSPMPLGVSWNKTRDIKNESSSLKGKSAPVTAPTAPPASIRQRLRTAKDYFALAKEILPQAKAGDPEAQYVLFETYKVCRHSTLGAKSESLQAARDEALRVFPNAPQLVSKYEAGYVKCHGFFTADAQSLGDPWDWLQKATDAGYALAQAITADERFLQDDLKAAVRAGGSPTYPTTYMPPIGGDATPRALLAVAVQSADPDVLIEIGELQNLLNPMQPRDVMQINRTAWMYVGCQRGADCSGYGPATVTNCGPNDGQCTPVPERFLTQVNNNWAPVQEKVNQITAALGRTRPSWLHDSAQNSARELGRPGGCVMSASPARVFRNLNLACVRASVIGYRGDWNAVPLIQAAMASGSPALVA
jgi:hypothetical protein